ncbi:MAG: D-alanyl-D-alanine carboxypeptidase [Xanthobacteraceae bacterium]|nr:D-alanyl-D-alanine carboxypeptidase [Xanthobacteraceae bacterium]
MGVIATVFAGLSVTAAHAEATLLIEADTGKVLQAENATYPWHPASLTKLMTAYVTLYNVKQGRINLNTLFTVSPTAVAQAPSKMGLPAGTQVTVDNALKMMMVKSANDMAVVLAEGVGGSVDGFSAMMNATAQRLGMTQTSYVNPNGLPADAQITSARDLGILARAFIRDLPEYEYFVHIPGIKFGRRVTMNFNKLLGRYPGADGMKTGFICASGFNLIASATHNNKRLIAIVLGAPSSAQRAVKAVQLLEKGFNGNKLAWLRPTLGTVDQLAPIDATPPDLRDEMCGPKRKRPPAENEDDDVEVSVDNRSDSATPSLAFAGLPTPTLKAADLMALPATPAQPVIVYTGPARSGEAVLAADAAETARQEAISAKRHRKGKGHKTAAKPGATTSEADAKPATAAAKPKAADKPVAKPLANAATPPAAKPASTAKPAAKPARPKPKDSGKPAAAQKTDTAPKT